MNGADLLARALKAQGVEWISTLCGHGLNEIYAACQRAGIRLIDTRNEQAAAYMAECWGRLTGQVGVCAASSGVAHANALTGVVNAHFDGAPMLLLTGSGPLATAGKGHFQDFDQVGLAAPMCKYARVLDSAQRIPELVHEAWVAALSGRPGPVHLTVPMDVQETAVEEGVLPGPVEPGAGPGAAALVDQSVELLAGAQRPLLVAGSGAFYAGAAQALDTLTSAFGIPVIVPIWDRGAIPVACSEFVGVVGAASGGPPLLQEADLVLALGVEVDYRVGYWEDLAAGCRLVRVDADQQRLHQGRAGEVAIHADPAAVLTQLSEACIERRIDGYETWLARARQQAEAYRKAVCARVEPREGLHGLDVVEVLGEVVDEEAVLVVDGGNIGQWFHQILARRHYPGHWLSCGRSGVVGYGLPGAMAARLCYPGRPVVLLSGDGSATFTLAELECAARQQLPFVAIVADDESWGITESGHRKRYGQALSSTLGPVDFAAVARGLGALGSRVENRRELAQALKRGLQENKPVLIHAPIVGGAPEA